METCQCIGIPWYFLRMAVDAVPGLCIPSTSACFSVYMYVYVIKSACRTTSDAFFCVQKVAEELELRQDLQVKLLQSEQQIASLKSSLSNRPSMEVTDFPPQIDITPSECGEV